MSDAPAERVEAYLVAGGRYHDIDFARVELLKLLAEHPHVRTQVAADYHDLDSIAQSKFLVTYTCDLRPTPEQQEALHDFVASGGRWLALHGTNSILEFTDHGVEAPKLMERMAYTLGSQFIAHPPIQHYKVDCVAPDHPLVSGIDPFETDDELYLQEYHDKENLEPLLETTFSGKADGFAESDWTHADRHLVSYLRPLGKGAVLYNTLGHCRGHWDMKPAMDYYPQIERCSWNLPVYHDLIRRALRWCLREIE